MTPSVKNSLILGENETGFQRKGQISTRYAIIYDIGMQQLYGILSCHIYCLETIVNKDTFVIFSII